MRHFFHSYDFLIVKMMVIAWKSVENEKAM